MEIRADLPPHDLLDSEPCPCCGCSLKFRLTVGRYIEQYQCGTYVTILAGEARVTQSEECKSRVN